jgi:hypothetical protein
MVLIVVLAALAVATLVFWRLRARPTQAERTLLRVCRGSRAQAESLMRHEAARAPGISRAEAAERAVSRYRRDNS